jgi:protein-S-isoprenylcysteine O-methyltransferase Ste14
MTQPQSPLTARPANQHLRIAILRGAFVLLLPLIIFSGSAWSDHPGLLALLFLAGLALVIAAVLGRFWAILYIGGRKNHMIMQDGPYSICRHPLYLSSTVGALGLGLMLGSLVLMAVIGGVTFLILSATAAREETYLREKFGPAYDAYAARVPRILPRPALYTSEPQVTFSVATLRENFFDALVFLGFIPLAMALNLLKLGGLIPTWPLW